MSSANDRSRKPKGSPEGGRFAPETGGRDNVPTPSPISPNPPAPQSAAPVVVEAYARFAGNRNRFNLPGWAVEPRFRDFVANDATDWDEDWVVSVSTDHDTLPFNGSPETAPCSKDDIVAVLRAQKVSEVREGNQIISVYSVPSVGDPDGEGRQVAIRYSHDERKVVQNYAIGYLSDKGTFKESSNFDNFSGDAVQLDSPVSRCAGGDIDDMTYQVVWFEDGTPAGIEVTAETSWYLSPAAEEDPDRFRD